MSFKEIQNTTKSKVILFAKKISHILLRYNIDLFNAYINVSIRLIRNKTIDLINFVICTTHKRQL